MIKRLGDICEFVGGGTPSKKNPEFYGGSIPWATVRDMNVRVIESTEHSITPDAVQQSATNIIPKGEVVISTHVGLGKVCFLGQNTAINQDLKAVIPRKGLSRRYLYYWFVSKADELIANGKGATVKGVTLDFVKNLRIPVLPVREQERVSDALDKLTHIIELSDSQIDRLDSVVKSRFVEMFGDIEDFKTLTEFGTIATGATPPMKNPVYYENNDVCFFKPSDLSNEVKRLHKSEYWVDRRSLDVARPFGRGTVLVSCIGSVGKIGIADVPGICNQQINFIEPNRDVVPVYLAYAILARKQVLIDMANAPVVPIVNKSQFSKMTIVDAPLALQRKFAAFVEKVDKLAFAARRRRDVAKQLYRAKIQEYFG